MCVCVWTEWLRECCARMVYLCASRFCAWDIKLRFAKVLVKGPSIMIMQCSHDLHRDVHWKQSKPIYSGSDKFVWEVPVWHFFCLPFPTDVIHTVGPVARGYVGKAQKELLSQCYQNSLALVKEYGLRSVVSTAGPSVVATASVTHCDWDINPAWEGASHWLWLGFSLCTSLPSLWSH